MIKQDCLFQWWFLTWNTYWQSALVPYLQWKPMDKIVNKWIITFLCFVIMFLMVFLIHVFYKWEWIVKSYYTRLARKYISAFSGFSLDQICKRLLKTFSVCKLFFLCPASTSKYLSLVALKHLSCSWPI